MIYFSLTLVHSQSTLKINPDDGNAKNPFIAHEKDPLIMRTVEKMAQGEILQL